MHYVSRGTLRNDRRTKQADDLEKAADEALSLRVELENAILLGDTPLARRNNRSGPSWVHGRRNCQDVLLLALAN